MGEFSKNATFLLFEGAISICEIEIGFSNNHNMWQYLRKETTWLPTSFLGYEYQLKEGTQSFKMVFKAWKSYFPILRYINFNI